MGERAATGAGHNRGAAPLRSHMDGGGDAADLQALSRQFIDGFRAAADKTAYLRLAGVPFAMSDGRRAGALKLVDVRLASEWQVGTASPAFGRRELAYLPFPGERVVERANMAFVYVSMDARKEVDLREFLRARLASPEPERAGTDAGNRL